MKCKICGATCRCKKAGPGICCDCHHHKAAVLRFADRNGPPWQLTNDEALALWRIAHGMEEEKLL